ncbi:GNAT family N-acetyltransferase [Legionella cardiaca]|uniref:GNAT family N-acetyltransferase n=1 Tax=Legionella cardiaca TaxID=1071983 RepID=A0ABY8AS27_9GAMM|nr:GNAT family N-acetyltransferase [Legionella cardiaca]WED43473.1 GNAT family N-acetyltransferase [Legionella cardiaca]
MLITKELAFKIETCIKQSHLQFTRQHTNGCLLEVGSGTAFFSGENSFFSQVIAWGFTTDYDKIGAELDAIEAFYRHQQHRQIDIELSPLVGNIFAHKLSSRGYLVSEMNNISVLDLSAFEASEVKENQSFTIEKINKNQLKLWAQCIALGFEYEEAWEQFYLYAMTENVIPFGAFLNNQLVAGGTIAIHNGICDLGITSTLPNYRGRGLQKALLYKRIEYAVQKKAMIASVTTEPGSISDLNIQKMGFQIAYTRIKFSCPLD